jgi:hypothetical protein
MRNQKAMASAVLMGIGALIVGICFVLDWTKDASGYDWATDGEEYYIWLVVVAAVLGLVWAIYVGYRGYTSSWSASAGSGIALLALIGVGIFFLRWFTYAEFKAARQWGLKMSYGPWGAIIGTVVMFIGDLIALTAMERGYMPAPYPGPTVPMPTPPPPQPIASAPPPRPAPRPAPPPVQTEVVGVPVQAVAWLVARSGSRAGQSFGLKQGDNTVGRDPSRADIVLDDPTMSGEHARIRLEGGQFYLYDLASTNGTFVNNRRVQRQMLMDNDVVRFGNAELVFKKA